MKNNINNLIINYQILMTMKLRLQQRSKNGITIVKLSSLSLILMNGKC